jgi:hypothetical protein
MSSIITAGGEVLGQLEELGEGKWRLQISIFFYPLLLA